MCRGLGQTRFEASTVYLACLWFPLTVMYSAGVAKAYSPGIQVKDITGKLPGLELLPITAVPCGH